MFHSVLFRPLNTKVQLAVIALLYLIVNSIVYHRHGVKVVNDTARYVEYASNLHERFYFDPHNFWYLGYTGYIFLFQSFHAGFPAMIAGQYILGFLAVVALYQTTRNLWDNDGAFYTAVMYILFIDIAQWNSYMLAESLYTSFVCFSLFLLSHWKKQKEENGSTVFSMRILGVLVILITSLIKPTGIALLGAFTLILVHRPIARIGFKPLRVSLRIAAGIFFLFLTNRMLTTYRIMENYQLGEVIYAITTIPQEPEYKWLVVTPPSPIYLPPDNYQPLQKIVAFIYHHPVYWTKLFLTKAFYLLIHIRPFWSWSHNLYQVLFLLPCYYLFMKGLRAEKLHREVVLFIMTYLAIQILSVCMTSEDWDGRFLIPLLPAIMLFSGQGFERLVISAGKS